MLLRSWAREGLTDKQIATERMHVAYSSFREWRNKYPAFSAALKKGKEPVDAELEENAFRNANGQYFIEDTVTDIYYEGTDANGKPIEVSRHTRTVKHQVPPNATMQIFLMKNRMPDKYREKREEQIKVTSADYTLLDEVVKEAKFNAE